ncbi:DNA-binding protein [Enterovibrio norvegicus]|uniref:DNA-binding protein n=1 Tax=Enterovibrio norvegicus TaxID=188144 RepID=UPI0010BE8B90|nr:DNA-binding protein [Enterovibrio norvegicus]TKF29245.1 hypothetical protein FCV83_22175 [Enterovibrio norvegicus]
MSEQSGVSFEQVSKAATSMLSKGVTPSVRGVIAVTGGKTETVSKHLRDFHEKRNAEVLKMADELGSSAIAKILATEVQTVVDRKSEQLQRTIEELKEQRDEVIELLSEQEKDCRHRVELAEAKAIQSINDAADKIAHAKERAEKAENDASESRVAAAEAKQQAENTIESVETKCDLLIGNAKSEATSLVDAANKRADKAEQEAESLREQVKLLSIEQAKREIEQEQYQQALDIHNRTLTDLVEERTRATKLEIQHESLTANIQRINDELSDTRADSKQLAAVQGQLIEIQKQLSQTQHDLSQSERERESLTLALRRQSE